MPSWRNTIEHASMSSFVSTVWNCVWFGTRNVIYHSTANKYTGQKPMKWIISIKSLLFGGLNKFHGEEDPDRNYFNQFSHQVSKSSNYYIEDSFNKYVKRNCQGNENLSFIHSYIRSIPANLNAFMSYMSNINCDFSVIGFSETWLNSSNIYTYSIDGYSHVRLTRETGKGGGVSLFICDSIMYCELPEFNMVCGYIECVFVKINCMGHNFIVGVVYRPPNSNISDFNDSIHDILEKVSNYPCYIMGDFNLDLLKHELHRPSEKFLDIMYANSYIPIINRPTRVTKDTCTLIDNIFTNNISINDHFFNGILTADITDHHILFHIIKSNNDKNVNDNEYKIVRIINESRINQFTEKIQNTDWSLLNSCRECQIYFSKFYTLLKTIYDEAFPLTRVKMRYRNRLPWLTDGLKNLSNIKIHYTGFHWNIPQLIIFQNTKIIKINFLPFWRKKKRIIIDQKFFQIRIISGKCATSSNRW